MKRFAVIGLLVCTLLVLQGAFGQAIDNWTILHYTAVDNDLEGYGLEDYYEMQVAGSGSGVNIVTQLDRAEGYDPRFGDWTTTRRFYIEYVEPLPEVDLPTMRAALVEFALSMDNGEQAASQVDELPDDQVQAIYRNVIRESFVQPPVEDLGEVDMGDPQALFDFIVWGVENYPAEHYLIVIGSHGAGWRGIGPDENPEDSILTLPEIDVALGEARAVLGIDRFDIIGFDACLMGVTDVAVALEQHADYVLFSQELIPGNGWEYTLSIQAMQANPDWDAFQVGANFIDNYMAYYAGPGARTKVGLSLIETAQLPTLLGALDNFTQVVGANTLELLSALGTARNNSQAFATGLGDRGDVYSYVDLRDFMNWFSLQTTITEDAYFAAQEVIAAYDAAVVYSLADDKLPRATGLAVYLPTNADVYTAYGTSYPDAAPPTFGFWQAYLDAFFATVQTELDGSDLLLEIDSVFTVGEVGSVLDNPIVSFQAGGRGVVDLTYTITALLDDGTRVIVDSFPIAYYTVLPTGETAIEYPNELTPSTFTWGAEIPFLSDGVNSVLAVAQATSASGGEAIIQGTLVRAEGEQPAYLVFDTATLTYTGLLTINDNAPIEAEPNPGDQFIVDLLSFSPDGELTVEPLTDQPLTFGIEPFTLTYQPALTGIYEIGLTMADLAGNRMYRSAEVAIDNTSADGTIRGYTDTFGGVYFQYPREWGDSVTLANDDGSVTQTVSDVDGLSAIFVDVYPEVDAADALSSVMAMFDVEYGDVIEIALGGQPGLAVEYATTGDAGPTTGVFVSLFNEGSNAAIMLTVQTSAGAAVTLEDLLALLDQTLMLFTPPA